MGDVRTMTNYDKLRAELARDEGRELVSYRDTEGNWTIGVGHLLGRERRMIRITNEECDTLLTRDIEVAENAADILVQDLTDPVQWRVLVNMAFNLGFVRLGKFKKFLTAVNAQDWPQAATEMMKSKWATQVGPRAIRLAQMMLTGTDARLR